MILFPMKKTQPTSVVTGAAGFLGSHLTDLLIARGHKVIGIDNFVTGSVNNIVHLVGVSMIACGWNHNVALLTNGTVKAWGYNGSVFGWNLTNVPPNLTNATVISAQALHSLALTSNGTVVAWGFGANGETNIPAGLSNVVAIAAGGQFNLAVQSNGTVTAWGYNGSGQCTVPAGLTNVADVAAGWNHSVALKKDGTLVCWGDNAYGECNVPTNLNKVVAITAGGDPVHHTAYTMAFKSDGTMAVWGNGAVVAAPSGLNGMIPGGGGMNFGLAILAGPPAPVMVLQPQNQFQLPGGSVTFTSLGQGVATVHYQWQFNGTNIFNATNNALTLTNVGTLQQGNYLVIVTNLTGSVTSSPASFALVTPPVITSQTLPTNQLAIYNSILTLSVSAGAPGQYNGFPFSYQWQLNGTNVGGANANSYSFVVDTPSLGAYSVIVTNVLGSVTSLVWQVTMTYTDSYIAPGTLAYYLSTNAAGYASGHTATYSSMLQLANWTYAQYTETNLALLTNAVWSTNCWLHGVRGLSSTCIGFINGLGGQGLVTMISPRHCLYAKHMHELPGYFVAAFLDTNNVIYWRTNMESVDVTNSLAGDTSVGILDSDLPPSVGYLPVLPENFMNYLPTTTYSYVQGIGMNQYQGLFGHPMTFADLDLGPAYVGWSFANTAPFGLGTNWNVALRPGDSSDPEMLLITNQLVLVSHNLSYTVGPNYAFQIDAVNQQMHYLSTNNAVGTDYQLTQFSLTNWPTIH